MKAPEVKPGLTVTLDGEEWTVLDKAPGPEPWSEEQVRANVSGDWRSDRKYPVPAFFWLHRWKDGKHETASAHARELTLVEDPYADARRKGRSRRA